MISRKLSNENATESLNKIASVDLSSPWRVHAQSRFLQWLSAIAVVVRLPSLSNDSSVAAAQILFAEGATFSDDDQEYKSFPARKKGPHPTR
jgi:hypothetical protein